MQKIKLDISKKLNIPTVLTKQGNVGQKIRIAVVDNGSPYGIPADAVISAWYSGDGVQGNYSQINGKSAFQISGNTIEVEMIAQMLRKAGNHELCLIINQSDGDQIGLWNIPYFVEPVPGADSAEAKQYFSALSEQIQDIRDTKTPYIGGNGNWWIGEEDTGVQARGEKGDTGDTGPQGEPGQDGAAGANGKDGADGVSPTVSISKTGKVTTITITDANGTQTAAINDGEDGEAGEAASITVDTELSETSENPVQNKVVKEAVDTLADTIPTDDHINSLIDAYIGEALGGEY